MSEQQWYYYKDNQQLGPADFSDLQGMAAAGELPPNTYVSQPGMSEWVELHTLGGISFPGGSPLPPPPPPGGLSSGGPSYGSIGSAASAGPSPWERARTLASSDDSSALTPHLTLLDRLLGGLRGMLSEGLLHGVNSLMSNLGHIAFALAVILLVLTQIIFAIKVETFEAVVMAVFLTLPLGFVLHFAAARFLHSGASLIRQSPSRLGSRSFLDVFALLAVTSGVAALVVLSYAGFKQREVTESIDFAMIGAAFGLFLFLLFVCGCALQPRTVNVEVGGETSAGNEALGIISFLAKLGLRLVPVGFGVGSAIALFTAVKLMLQVFDGEYFAFMGQAFGIVPMPGGDLLNIGLMPLFAYLTFLTVYLVLDLYRAILATPRRIVDLGNRLAPAPADDSSTDA